MSTGGKAGQGGFGREKHLKREKLGLVGRVANNTPSTRD